MVSEDVHSLSQKLMQKGFESLTQGEKLVLKKLIEGAK